MSAGPILVYNPFVRIITNENLRQVFVPHIKRRLTMIANVLCRKARPVLAIMVVLTIFLSTGKLRGGEKVAPVGAPPVTKVVLYKHGMGYIERQGKVRDTATMQLAFRADQMKDLLTSFYAVDLSGGRIVSVQYETKDPLSKQIQDILITVPENNALSQFLTQLKGARITVKASGETIEGRVLGTEPIIELSTTGQTVRNSFRLVILTDAGPIRSADLFAITEFSLADEALQRDLSRLLTLTLDSKYTNRKKLTLTASGQGEREVRLGYLVEMPIWKTSYRLILNAKEKDSAMLQGWAQAENTTEEDWKDVSLSFVAGNPFSYVMDLYTPLYIKRPQAAIPGLQDMAVDWSQTSPPEIDRDEGKKVMELPRSAAAPTAGRARPGGGIGAFPGAANVAQSMDAMNYPVQNSAASSLAANIEALLGSSVGAAAQGTKVAELFNYTVTDKVSIPRGQAALVPIVSKTVQGKRVVYYKAAFSPKATNAWVLRNDTDVTFEAGAVTFFEGSTSIGEGILAHTLPPGSQEVLPYAIDASIDVDRRVKNEMQPYYKGKLVDGILNVTRVETLSNTWKLTNRSKETATLWLNQPITQPYKLSKPEKPLKEVDNHYRFEVILKPGETTDFVVEEKRDVQETVDVGRADVTRVKLFASGQYLSPALRALLTDVAELMAKKATLQRQINEWQDQTRRYTEEQNRLRQNVNTTSSNTPAERDLRAKWMNALSAAEDNLTSLRGKIDEASGQIRQLDEELAKKIREFKE
jgi:hypothetical protein